VRTPLAFQARGALRGGWLALVVAGCATAAAPRPPPASAPPAGRPDRDGDGIPDAADLCPEEREDHDGFQDEDGCPDPDNDGDGVPDAVDACPNDPGPGENRGCPVRDRDVDGVPDGADRCPDRAGPAHRLGCPEPDRDGDGVADGADSCPDLPGVAPGGCPRRLSLVVVHRDRIEIRQQVRFASGRSSVLPASGPLLDQVAQVMRDRPRLRVRVEGHTDRTGGEARNLALSQGRAEAVKAALVARGVEPARLRAVGFGSSRPLASNRTAQGRAKNRRTEFHVSPPVDTE
jgi:outer membrane protein OmpA-like peptidoglycan-associated protein